MLLFADAGFAILGGYTGVVVTAVDVLLLSMPLLAQMFQTLLL